MKTFFFLFVFHLLNALPGFSQAGNTADSALQKTVIWNLPPGDSVMIFESRILFYDTKHSSGDGALMQVLFPGRSNRSYSQTSKYVVRREASGYRLVCYVSDRDRSPNYKFDRVMKKEKYWHFKKYLDRTLTQDEVDKLCLFECVCTGNALNKYDEGDISRSMTVIRHKGKEVCSSYRDASVLDEIIKKK